MSVRYAVAAMLAAVMASWVGASGAGAASHDVVVTLDRSYVATELGDRFAFRTTVSNHGQEATAPLIAHLNVLSLQPGVYVDPEDWSSDRTRYLGSIAAGDSRTITWSIHAVNDGMFAAYITVLPQKTSDRPPTTSDVVEFVVAKRTTLNSGGVLPLAIGIPACIALIAGGVSLARRRRLTSRAS